MISVGTIIGDVALVFPTGLKTIISSKRLPPDENGDTQVGRTSRPSLWHLVNELVIGFANILFTCLSSLSKVSSKFSFKWRGSSGLQPSIQSTDHCGTFKELKGCKKKHQKNQQFFLQIVTFMLTTAMRQAKEIVIKTKALNFISSNVRIIVISQARSVCCSVLSICRFSSNKWIRSLFRRNHRSF